MKTASAFCQRCSQAMDLAWSVSWLGDFYHCDCGNVAIDGKRGPHSHEFADFIFRRLIRYSKRLIQRPQGRNSPSKVWRA
jgi:hypothetical protein